MSALWHSTIPSTIELIYSLRLLIAVVLGASIGIERSLAGKHAGMRTYAMVALGSAVFVIAGTLASYTLAMFSSINPLQIASSVVVGIGFIGSGLSLFHGDRPAELTTASGVWVVSGVGMLCGFGFFLLAVATTVLSLGIFTILSRAERRLQESWGTDRN